MKKQVFKKITALIIALSVAVVPYLAGFATDELPFNEEISVPVTEDSSDFTEPEVPEIPDEPVTEPENPDENEIVASVSICSSMSVPVIAGHTYIYVHNLSDEPIKVGLYEVPVDQGVSVGTFSFSVSDGWGLYYNIEAYRENHDNVEGKIWSKTRQLNASQLEKLSNNIKNYLNYWDPFFNCSFFAFSIWNVSVGDLLIPLVLPVLSHLMVMMSGARRGVLDMYCPAEEQVYRQRGSGSNARLEPVSVRTLS